MLKETDLTLSLSKQAYKQVMHYQIQRMYELEHLAYTTDVPVIILFEGWDAAGKGTAICRLTERLDPRGFKVLPTQAPRTHEMQKPWLWRFLDADPAPWPDGNLRPQLVWPCARGASSRV